MEIVKGWDETLYREIAKASCNKQAVRDVECMRRLCYLESGKEYCERIGNASMIMAFVQKRNLRIYGMATREEDKGKGYASLLLKRAEQFCRENHLPIMTTITISGKTFYEQHGFKVIGTNEGGCQMEKKLQGVVPKLEQTYLSPRWSGEITDCTMPMTFDTYSNCSFGCVYCFSQYQRGVGNTKEAYLRKECRSVNPEKIKKIFTDPDSSQFGEYVKTGRVFQWGGLSDEFDGFERKYGVTLELLKFFKAINYPICFSTKSTWPFFDERYRELFRGQDNWNMKFSIITLDEKIAKKVEVGVPSPQERLRALHEYTTLNKGGATLRLRPFIIGISSRDYKELIVAAHDAGADAVTTEFLCLDSRNVNTAAEHYQALSEACGFDIYAFYRKHSKGNGYLRLNRKLKEGYIKEMKALCDKLGMRFYVSDAHFKETCANGCCCGLPPEWNYSRGNFSYALQLCRRNGMVQWKDIAGDMYFLEKVMFRSADGFNTNNSVKRAKYFYMTMKDYLHHLWNDPTKGQSPYKMFEGIMQPNGLDENGDIIYIYNEDKTFMPGYTGLSGQTEHGFLDVLE